MPNLYFKVLGCFNLIRETGYGLGGRVSIRGRVKRFLFSPQCPYRLCGPPSLLPNVYRGVGGFPGGQPARALS
jgi:hypothetical protein